MINFGAAPRARQIMSGVLKPKKTEDSISIWVTGDRSECSKQSRSITFYMGSDDSQCSLNKKESVTRSCSPPCAKWVAHSWSSCTKLCGGGRRTQLYRCELNGSKVPDSDCNSSLKSEITEKCNTYECPSWSTGSWGSCSASCNGGVKTRFKLL